MELHTRLLWLGYNNLTADDAFILFRFTYNLAGELSLVFNPGERVCVFKSQLYPFGTAVWRKLSGADFIFGARLFV